MLRVWFLTGRWVGREGPWSSAEIIAVLEKSAFSLARQRGSHMIYKNSDGKRVTIPFHGSKVAGPSLPVQVCFEA
jgi:predicted RNA binding protein YcfA (HicA-like mRNA interferase family)